jgi:ATP-dependent DNA ligase
VVSWCLYADHVLGNGSALYQSICAKDLEGVVLKHKFGPYSTTPQSWFKILNQQVPSPTRTRFRLKFGHVFGLF